MKLSKEKILEHATDTNVVLRTVLKVDHDAEPEVMELFKVDDRVLMVGISSQTVVEVSSTVLDQLTANVEHWNIYRLDPECMLQTMEPVQASE